MKTGSNDVEAFQVFQIKLPQANVHQRQREKDSDSNSSDAEEEDNGETDWISTTAFMDGHSLASGDEGITLPQHLRR